MYNESLREQKKLVRCEDGTNTLFSVEFDESYHSTKDGALHESLEKHVKPGLALSRRKTELTILDICFGLGYNTFTTLYYIKTQSLKSKVHIISPEFDEGLVRSLETFDFPSEFDEIKPIIKAVSQDLFYEDDQFKIEILLGDARKSIPTIQKKIDIVYQDAFSPKQNPLLWTKEWFSDIRAICTDDVILTTYSTAIATRMGLYENDFYVFIYSGEKMRSSTIASPKMLTGLEYVDMELKKVRNPEACSLKDEEFLKDMNG
jgi:tRNA U34 5-methylaminomethyl-2-thiouridine-forming methyltransferase MnmC